VGSSEYVSELKMMLNVCKTISFMRKEYICRFGDAPSGFTALPEPLSYLAKFGVRMDTIDISAVMQAYKTSKANGYWGSKIHRRRY